MFGSNRSCGHQPTQSIPEIDSFTITEHQIDLLKRNMMIRPPAGASGWPLAHPPQACRHAPFRRLGSVPCDPTPSPGGGTAGSRALPLGIGGVGAATASGVSALPLRRVR